MRLSHVELQRDVVAHVGRRLGGVMSSVREASAGQPGHHEPSTATLLGDRSLPV